MRALILALMICSPAAAEDVHIGSVVLRGQVYGNVTLQLERVSNEEGDALPSPRFYLVDEQGNFAVEEVPSVPVGHWFLAIRREHCAPIVTRVAFDVRNRDHVVRARIHHGECMPEEQRSYAQSRRIWAPTEEELQERANGWIRVSPTPADAVLLRRQLEGNLLAVAPAVDTRIRAHILLVGESGTLVVRTDDDESTYQIEPMNETLSYWVANHMMRLHIAPFAAEHASVDIDFILPASNTD